MRREVMETIAGIEIFPIISLIIFAGFFAIMLWWVVRLDKPYLNNASCMPLDEELPVTSSHIEKNLMKGDENYGKEEI